MRHADVLTTTRPDNISVQFHGYRWPLEMSTAAQWIGAIGYNPENLVGVFPGGIADDDLEPMWDLLWHQDAQRRCLNAARVAVQRGGGRDWWWTVNLVRKSLGIWPYINGQLMLHGVDAGATAFPSWLDAAFAWLWTNSDKEGRTKLELQLSMRPRGVIVRSSPAADKKMLEAFAAD